MKDYIMSNIPIGITPKESDGVVRMRKFNHLFTDDYGNICGWYIDEHGKSMSYRENHASLFNNMKASEQ